MLACTTCLSPAGDLRINTLQNTVYLQLGSVAVGNSSAGVMKINGHFIILANSI